MRNEVNEAHEGTISALELRGLLDLSPDMVGMVGRNGRWQWVNAAFCRVLGCERDELLNTPLLKRVHPEDKAQFLAEVAEAVRQKLGTALQCRFQVADGSYRRFGWQVEGVAGGGLRLLLREVAEGQPQRDAVAAEQFQLASLVAAVGQVLTRPAALSVMLQGCAEGMVAWLETAVVHIWTVERPSNTLWLQASAGQTKGDSSRPAAMPFGQGMIDHIAKTQQPYCTNSAAQDSILSAAGWVQREGVCAFAGYPLLHAGKLVGVMTLVAHHPLFPATHHTLLSVAQSMAFAIHGNQAQQALQRTCDELEIEVAKRNAELAEKNILLRTQMAERDATDILLRKRAAELEIVTRVSAAASSIAETEQLMQEVVNLIKVSFDLYHAHFYVLNDVRDALVLSIGAGEVGRKLLEKGHTIPLTQPNSLVVRAAVTGKGVIENDLYAAPGYLANPLLPESRSSMAIPMIVGDEVLGVLNVQSDVVNHFTDEDVRIQTTLAAQIALALQHTRSLERAQTAIGRLNDLTRRLSREGWADYLTEQAVPQLGFAYDLVQTRPTHHGSGLGVEPRQLVKQRLVIQGAEVGELLLADPQEFEEDVAEILQDVAEQLTFHMETLRLSEQTREALARTEGLYASSGQIVRAGSSEEVLEALVYSVGVDQFAGAGLLFFDRPWSRSRPDYMQAAAAWTNPAVAMEMVPVGSVFPLSRYPSLWNLRRDEPMLLLDVTADERAGADLQALLVEQLGVRGIVFFPLVAGQEWFGFFVGLTLNVLSLGEEQVRRLRSLTDQAAAVVQNLRLFKQTEAALAQTEALYQISASLNAATDLDDVAQAIAARGAVWTGVWLLVRDGEKRPFSLELAGSWSGRQMMPVSLGAKMPTSWIDLPEVFADVMNPAPRFLPDLHNSEVALMPEAYDLVQQQGFESGIVLPLRYGEAALGVATIAWDVEYQFEEADRSFYRLLMVQVGVAVHSHLLLRDSRRRSEQLAKLAQVERALSLAQDETEIVLAVANGLEFQGIDTIALAHIDEAEGSGELWLRLVTLWSGGAFLSNVAELLPVQPLAAYGITALWLGRPDELLVVEDVATDERATEAMRGQAARDGWRATALLPLRIGGRWQGVLVFNWATPRQLTVDEQFLLSHLLEPVAATLATRRAFVAQLAARQEMAELYAASRRLNEAVDLRELLESVVASVAIEDVSRANLWLFEPSGARLLAVWAGDAKRPTLPVGTVMSLDADGFGAFLRQTESQFVVDVAVEPSMPEPVRLFTLGRGVRSLVLLPLLVQGEGRGLIMLSAEERHEYTERERRICASLMPQIAIVLENKRLLEAAQERAERERLLREVTERVRRSLHVETVMRTAVEEVGRVLGRRAIIYREEKQ